MEERGDDTRRPQGGSVTVTTDATPEPPASRAPAVATPGRQRLWTSSVFALVDEGKPRRRPSDIARLAVAALLVALTSAGAAHVTSIEGAIIDLVASLPGGWDGLWRFLYRLAPVVAGALVLVALLGRRLRLFATQALAVGVAAAVGATISATVDLPSPLPILRPRRQRPRLPHRPDRRGHGLLLGLPPYLTRPARRLLEASSGSRAGRPAWRRAPGCRGSPASSLAWGAAAVAHLRFGSPGGHAVRRSGRRLAPDLGVDPAGLALATEQTWGGTASPPGRTASSRSRSSGATAPTPACSPSSGGSSGTRTPARRCR